MSPQPVSDGSEDWGSTDNKPTPQGAPKTARRPAEAASSCKEDECSHQDPCTGKSWYCARVKSWFNWRSSKLHMIGVSLSGFWLFYVFGAETTSTSQSQCTCPCTISVYVLFEMICVDSIFKLVTQPQREALETSVLLDQNHRDPLLEDSGGLWSSDTVISPPREKLMRVSDQRTSSCSPAASVNAQSDRGENIWLSCGLAQQPIERFITQALII